MTRILVTGADGFVGRHLLPVLMAAMPAGSTIVRATRSPRFTCEDEVMLDLLDEDSVRRAVATAQPSVVIHLAAQSSVAGSDGSAPLTWAINHGGTVSLARAIGTEAPDATVLFASSAEVYGAAFNDGIVSEISPVKPLSPYAQSKAAAEQALRDLLPDTARLIVARPTNHSGAGQSATFVIPSFARQIVDVETGRGTVVRVGQLASRRDFLDVADVVAAYRTLLSSADRLPARSVFNIASGSSISIESILEELRALARVPIPVTRDPLRMRPSEVPTVKVDAGALRGLGWVPTVPLRATLESVLASERLR